MIYEKAKIYSDGSHYIAIPHTTRWTKPRLKKQEKEITVDENLKPVQDKQEPITPNGVVLTQVEFVDGELVPVMKTVKSKELKQLKSKSLKGCTRQIRGLNDKLLRAKIIDGVKRLFKDLKSAENYVDDNLERKKRNLICRRTRMVRKVNLQK